MARKKKVLVAFAELLLAPSLDVCFTPSQGAALLILVEAKVHLGVYGSVVKASCDNLYRKHCFVRFIERSQKIILVTVRSVLAQSRAAFADGGLNAKAIDCYILSGEAKPPQS